MAGSGAALRLHEFKEFLHCEHLHLQKKASRLGRDTHGLYPGQLGRVHPTTTMDHYHGSEMRSLAPKELSNQNSHESSFDVRILRAVLARHRPEERHLLTSYQEHFGLQSHLRLE
ncbi:unnamed protein product [Knipowitschia caucasica]